MDPKPTREPRALARTAGAAGGLTFRRGSEVVAVAEALYLRLFVIALGCMLFVCGLAIVVALARTHNASFERTTALALGLALPAALALRERARAYRIIRRRPFLSLTPSLLALGALGADGVLYSPLSFPAAVCVAVPAFVCGRRWAVAAATLISVGAITTATLLSGPGALSSVGQGAAGYFAWALVLAGLAERFAQLAMQLPAAPLSRTPPAASIAAPGDPGDPTTSAQPAAPSAPTPGTHATLPDANLTARQIQVVALLADGLRADDIADHLGISTSTVYRHIERAKTRTRVASRSELIAVAIRNGVLPEVRRSA